jgi:hypothetical protein
MTSMTEPEKYLTRRQLADLLKERGYPVSLSSLNKLGAPAIGQGPKVAAYWPGRGRHPRPLYKAADGIEWAERQLRRNGNAGN